jgi:putative hydrolase of the HAD superfamily
MQRLLPDNVFQAVLFDMDNTLFDFVAAMMRGMQAAVEVVGAGTGYELFSYYVRGKYHVEDHANLQDFMSDHHVFKVDTYLAAIQAFEAAKLTDLFPYPGIPEILEDLREAGYRLSVVTDAYSYAAEKRLKHTGLDRYFSALVAYDTTGYKKPHHAPFECALDLLGIAPHEAVYIGDSVRRDIEPAQALGMAAVYAAYGDRNFYDAGRPCPPKVLVAEKPEDIRRILL